MAIGRRDHEEHVDHRAEAGQQARALLAAFLLGEAVETEAIDQQMGHPTALGLLRHVAIELLVDHPELVAGQGAGVLAGLAQAVVVEQILAPDVRADQGEIGPVETELLGELAL